VSVGSAALVALGTLLAVNYLVVRTDLARRWPPLFWTITGLDLVLSLAVFLVGVPGLQQSGLVRLTVGLVLLMHLAQNLQVRARWLSEEAQARLDAEMDERRRYLEQEDERETPPT
jgi:hypothetical protein